MSYQYYFFMVHQKSIKYGSNRCGNCQQKWNKYQVFILSISEISIVSLDIPFAGLTVILLADLHQLPLFQEKMLHLFTIIN